jgi:hypothetical protein
MIYTCSLDIAGISIALACNHAGLCKALNQRYRAFLTDRESQFKINITWEKKANSTTFVIPDISIDGYRVTLNAPEFSGFSDVAKQQAEITIQVATPVEAVDYFLRVVFAFLAFEAQGIMVHGAGILHKENGYLFFGHSGSGKTTLSRLSVNDAVLNDDLVVLMPLKKAWKMYGTPFWHASQIQPNPLSAPLVAMYRLVQDKSVSITALKPGQALAELMSNIPIIPSDTKLSKLILDRCMMLLQRVPAYQLHFLPDASFWQAINNQYS